MKREKKILNLIVKQKTFYKINDKYPSLKQTDLFL